MPSYPPACLFRTLYECIYVLRTVLFSPEVMLQGPVIFRFVSTLIVSCHHFFILLALLRSFYLHFLPRGFRSLHLGYIYLVDHDHGWVPLVDIDQLIRDFRPLSRQIDG